MKYKLGDKIKKKKTKADEHADYEILSTFISNKFDGYIIVDLYTNRVMGIESNEFDIETKLSSRPDDIDDAMFYFLKQRYDKVKKQVINHPEVINPKFKEW